MIVRTVASFPAKVPYKNETYRLRKKP